jgi:sulfotransferase
MQSVYMRAEQLTRGVLGAPTAHLKQAWFGEHSHKLLVVAYDRLVRDPSGVLQAVYEWFVLTPFDHDFANISYDEPEFDAKLGFDGFHRVSGPLRATPRQTILPNDLFMQYDKAFWETIGDNPRGVKVLT